MKHGSVGVRHVLAVAVAIFCWIHSPINLGALGARGRPISTGVVDKLNLFPNVGALLVVVVPNDFGVPEGILAFCSGTLIHERAFLTAGHCTGPSSFAPLPPFIKVFVSLNPNALDRSTWRPVVEHATHPSIPPCPPPLGCDPTTQDVFHALDPGISDIGLALLAEPVVDVPPASLSSPNALESRAATRQPMLFVGYGFRKLGPDGEIPPVSEWDGWRRIHASRMKQVVDDTWASWTLPSQVCFGDSGGPTFLSRDPLGAPFALALVAVASDGGVDCISRDDRSRVDTSEVQQWIRSTIRELLSPN